MTVIFQIDVLNPLDKKQRQQIPLRDTKYANKLDFRVRYDSQIIEAHKNQVRKAMYGERARDLNDKRWMNAAFTVKDDSPGLLREIEIEVPKSP